MWDIFRQVRRWTRARCIRCSGTRQVPHFIWMSLSGLSQRKRHVVILAAPLHHLMPYSQSALASHSGGTTYSSAQTHSATAQNPSGL